MEFQSFLTFLHSYITTRLEWYFNGSKMPFPDMKEIHEQSSFGKFISKNKLTTEEIIVLLIALVPHIDPGFFTGVIANFLPKGGDFPEFGGVKGKNHRGLIPTGETALFILGGMNIGRRMQLMCYFDMDHLFARKGVLKVEEPEPGEPKMSGRLLMDEEYADLFTTGKVSKPEISVNFPAERITTSMSWEDLILPYQTLKEVNEIQTWLQYNDALLDKWQMRGKVKPGYRVLFFGPPGTGKTFTSVLLGKATGRDVFRIDLSMVVSKYIGETEKNLSKLFDKAADKDWILFFDEADSIFGKRTGVRDAHDKYANQEISYLLQRLEAHGGLVILASNLKSNIDPAFTRRFNLMVEFKNPDKAERLRLWKHYLPDVAVFDEDVRLEEIAGAFDLTGAGIVNVIQRMGLQALAKKQSVIRRSDILDAIKREYKKEERLMG